VVVYRHLTTIISGFMGNQVLNVSIRLLISIGKLVSSPLTLLIM